MRISRDEYLMTEAWNAARRSTCLRLQVGAVLVRDGRVVVSGYNGAPRGWEHCTPETCHEAQPCVRTVHAEMNCLLFAARHGISAEGTSLFTTDSPCVTCSMALINSAIAEVVFLRPYRVNEGIFYLTHAGIHVRQIFVENPFAA